MQLILIETTNLMEIGCLEAEKEIIQRILKV